jgi:hypothetical protein
MPATTLYMALRVARQARLDETATRGLLGATLAGQLDGRGLPPVRSPRRGASIELYGRLARIYGYASLVGPALFTGAVEQGRAMLEMAIASCRDPDPGPAGEAIEAIAPALEAANVLLDREDGIRPAIDLIYRANVCAATEVLDGV